MANNYTQFSFCIVTTTREESTWWLTLRDFVEDHLDAGEEPEEWSFNGVFNEEEQKELKFIFSNSAGGMTIEENQMKVSNEIFIYSEESADIETTAVFCLMYIKRFCPKSCIAFTWARYCDKPRVNEFNGGYVIVDHDGHTIKSAYELMNEALSQLGKRPDNL